MLRTDDIGRRGEMAVAIVWFLYNFKLWNLGDNVLDRNSDDDDIKNAADRR